MATALLDLPRRLPWWLAAAAGVVCVLLGAVLTVRPFASLTVLVVLVSIAMLATGVSRLVGPGDREQRVLGAGWLLAGLVTIAVPEWSTRGLAIVAGVVLIVDGIVGIVTGVREPSERVLSLLTGAAGVLFGILALAWPDVTLLVLAVLFGVRTLVFGVQTTWAALRRRGGRGERPSAADVPPAEVGPRRGQTVLAAATLVIALLLTGVSVRWNRAAPAVDASFTAPGDVPERPGALVREEPFTRGIPERARARRILYTTTRADGAPALASAIVVLPREPSFNAPPVLAWAHGTTGVHPTCAPSLLREPFTAGALFALDGIVANGWVLVAPDYTGLGTEGPHPYLIGEAEARSVLDAVRAARELPGKPMGDRTVIWGHSQGGHAALWSGIVGPRYAPDVRLDGIAALAPASDLPGLVTTLATIPGGSLFASYVLDGYANTYTDVRVDDYVRRAARTHFDAAVRRCLEEPAAVASLVGSLVTGMSMFSPRIQEAGPLRRRLEQNVPSETISASLLIAQGEADQLIPLDLQQRYVADRCAARDLVDFRTYAGRDHVGLVREDSPLLPQLTAWTADRFSGRPAASTCPLVQP